MTLQTLTDEMKSLFGKQIAILATTNAAGFPQIGPKGSMRVLDDQHLIYNERTSRQALHNLSENGRAAVLLLDASTGHAYRYEGTAHIESAGERFETALKEAEDAKTPVPRAIVIIDIERIFNLGSYKHGDYLLAGEPYEDSAI